jgi:hypothetical protein
MARELTWHERRATNLRMQRRDGQLQRTHKRANPSTGMATANDGAHTPPASTDAAPPEPHDDFPQPLQGFDYSFGAVG